MSAIPPGLPDGYPIGKKPKHDVLYDVAEVICATFMVILIVGLLLCVVAGVYFQIQTGEWNEITAFAAFFVLLFAGPWMLINLVVPGIVLAVKRLYKLILGD